MKKIILSLSILILGIAASGASAQSIRWGVKGGMNFTQAPKVNEILKSEARMGYHIGPMVELGLPIIPVSIDAALLFSTTSSEIKDASDAWNQMLETNYIELPINLKATVFNAAGFGIMIVAGPSFNYLINHNLKDLTDRIDSLDKFKANKFAVGLNAGIGIEAFNLLQITATYNATFSDTYKFESVGQSVSDFFNARNKGFRLSAAVLF